MTAINPYQIALTVFRNREWVQTITMTGTDISSDSLALVVIPGSPGSAPTEALISATAPVLDGTVTGKATFTVPDAQMGALRAGGLYTWQYLRKPSGSANSDCIVAGQLIVQDSPPFPSTT